ASTVELENDTITGGTVALNGTGSTPDATQTATLGVEGTVTLSATTTTTLSNSINNVIAAITDEGLVGTPTLINKGSLSGAGSIGGNGLVLNNSGASADIAAIYSGEASELVLATAANAILNSGTPEAKSGGTLEIASDVTKTGGTIQAVIASTVELEKDTITGCTVALNGTGSTLDGAQTATLGVEGTV